LAHNVTLVTRNVADVAPTGVELFLRAYTE
jgi:hypothetical protein